MSGAPSLSDLNIAATLPASFLALYACLLMVVDLFIPQTRKHITAGLTMLGLAISLVLALLPLGGVARFGDGYRHYRRRTPAFFPRTRNTLRFWRFLALGR